MFVSFSGLKQALRSFVGAGTGLALLSAIGAGSAASEAENSATLIPAVLADACKHDVVMLGEGGLHGAGGTIALKADIAKALVETCSFDVILFEPGFYDFTQLRRLLRDGQATNSAMLRSATGWLLGGVEQFQPFISYMYEKAAAGQLLLGGLDYQLGSYRAFYSNDQMLHDLTDGLQPADRDRCFVSLRGFVYGKQPDGQPLNQGHLQTIFKCLDRFEATLKTSGLSAARVEDFEGIMINILWRLASALQPRDVAWNARDKAMFDNLEMARRTFAKGKKIIVWSVNEHVAKQPRPGAEADASASNQQQKFPFGAYAARAGGGSVFSIGFSAAGGDYRYSFRGTEIVAKPYPRATEGSLEHSVYKGMEGKPAVYVQPALLQNMGTLSGAFFGVAPSKARWGEYFDALIVLKEEEPARVISLPDRCARQSARCASNFIQLCADYASGAARGSSSCGSL